MTRLWLGLAGLVLVCCQSEKPTHTAPLIPAFYHWKATFAPTLSDCVALDSLGVNTLYIRFFDVDWNAAANTAIPKAITIFRRATAGRRVVPVIYITTQTVANLPPGNVPELAGNIVRKIRELAVQQRIVLSEIQIDCDWTRTTQRRYFALLKAIGQQARLPLSTTIRLHQVKFAAQTGVPPVSRGMLMAYNTGDWKQPATRHSILDLHDLANYVGYLPGYPLPLDVALPLFRWTVVYRNNRFLTLLNNVGLEQLRAQSALHPQPDSTRFVVRRDTSLNGVALRPGDLLRAEACTAKMLHDAAELLLAYLPDQKRTFTHYHLDSIALQPYRYADLRPPRTP